MGERVARRHLFQDGSGVLDGIIILRPLVIVQVFSLPQQK